MGAKIVMFSTTPGMTQKSREVFVRRNCEDIPIYEVTTTQALIQGEKSIREGARVIICRGGTAEYLRRFLEIPIVDVRHSFLSLFQTVQQLRGQYHSIAVVGYNRTCEIARKYNAVMESRLGVYEVTSNDQFEMQIKRAASEAMEVIIGGFQVQAICKNNGYQYSSSVPDDTEINQALDEAFFSLRIEEERTQQYSLLSTVLNSTGEGIISINYDGYIIHTNKISRSLLRCSDGMPLSDFMAADKFLKTAQTGENFHGEIINVYGNALVCSCQGINRQGRADGAVITIQEESTIRTLDSHIRKRELGRGHFAKREFSDIIGNSEALNKAQEMARRYACATSTVLITGETGTGKEMFAQAIHNYSQRSSEPFVAINCAALPQNILESELFGYVKGAFTGARNEGKAGIFELAHRGTVFLDEISEMSADMQVKLLRVLQEKEVTRIGDDKVLPIDVRILAACNKDLLKEIANGNFREDLYYRVCVLELEIPPLRERTQDIPMLVHHFMHGRKSLTVHAQALMMQYGWPGNIRQLSNITERLDVLCDSAVITEEDVKKALQSQRSDIRRNLAVQSAPPEAPAMPERIDEMEQRLIRDALLRCDNNRERAAELLGISKTTLWRRLNQMGL